MMRYRVWWMLLAAVLLAGCSGDSEQPEGGVPGSDKPTPSVPDATEIPLQLVSATRALDPSAVSPAGESHDPIQMFLMSGDAESTITHLAEGQFVYDATASPQWSSTIGLKNTYNCIYGFSPATAASGEISLPTGITSYKDGAVLTLTNINPVMGSDLCVIVGVSHGTNSTTDAPAEIPDRGKFYFEKKTNNYITVLLDHLFAKISFCVKIDPDYHTMRAIKVKKIELLSDKTLTAVKVPLTANESYESPIGTIQYTTNDVASDADLPSGTIYDFTTDTDATHSEGVELPEDDSWTIPGFFAPAGNGDAAIGRHLSVRFTYDVYAYDVFDNNNKVRVRENCVAVNSLPHVTIDGADLQRGQSTTITLTVKPTYLYQLSESELDNPKITIGN